MVIKGKPTSFSRLKKKAKCLFGIHEPRTITTYYNEAVVCVTHCKVCKKEIGITTFVKPVPKTIDKSMKV